MSEWEKELLRIARLEKDIEVIRSYTKKFALNQWSLNTDYYRQCKKTFTPAEWKEEFEKLVTERTEKVNKELGQRINRWPGERDLSLVQQLKEKYPRRPAMVEELNKI